MKYQFSNLSKRRMRGIKPKLKKVLRKSLKRSPVDFGIAWRGGRRTAEEQYELFQRGVTYKDGYNKISKHQTGDAFDILPYVKGEVKDVDRYYYIIIGVIMATAKEIGVKLRNGGDWDTDGEYVTDQDFNDLGHFELIN